MPLSEPGWWYRDGLAWQAALLAPLGWLYGRAAQARYQRALPYRSRYPVICIGNFTAGGTGKTPMALGVASILRDLGRTPVFLSRGYGGTLNGPIFIDATRHTAASVGDEPLLLAQSAPAVVARDRAAGAQFIERAAVSGTVIVMDDGLQNPSLVKDLTIAVIDGQRGLGNLGVIPAGPLRAPLAFQTALANALVINGGNETQHFPGLAALRQTYSGPLLAAQTQVAANARPLKDKKVVGYAGIANPGRFFRALETQGAIVCDRMAFRDHHVFSPTDCERLLTSAAAHGASLITTQKDFARLQGRPEPPLQRLRSASQTLDIELVLAGKDPGILRELIAAALAPKK